MNHVGWSFWVWHYPKLKAIKYHSPDICNPHRHIIPSMKHAIIMKLPQNNLVITSTHWEILHYIVCFENFHTCSAHVVQLCGLPFTFTNWMQSISAPTWLWYKFSISMTEFFQYCVNKLLSAKTTINTHFPHFSFLFQLCLAIPTTLDAKFHIWC